MMCTGVNRCTHGVTRARAADADCSTSGSMTAGKSIAKSERPTAGDTDDGAIVCSPATILRCLTETSANQCPRAIARAKSWSTGQGTRFGVEMLNASRQEFNRDLSDTSRELSQPDGRVTRAHHPMAFSMHSVSPRCPRSEAKHNQVSSAGTGAPAASHTVAAAKTWCSR